MTVVKKLMTIETIIIGMTIARTNPQSIFESASGVPEKSIFDSSSLCCMVIEDELDKRPVRIDINKGTMNKSILAIKLSLSANFAACLSSELVMFTPLCNFYNI